MLRFLSNYLFQNENEPNEDPTATINQNPNDVKEQPSQSQEIDDLEGPTKPMDLEEGENLDDDDDEDQDEDWVLIGDGEKKPEEEDRIDGNVSKLTAVEEVALVAPNDDDEEEGQEDEDIVQEEGTGLLWENKLIEHPSMSVYIDLAQSLTNGTTSCMSLSSIAPATSPGESVIVLEHDDGESDDEDMDILDTIEVVQVELPKEVPAPKKATPTPIPAPVQNGRRKKGHYPCSSSNVGNMPRRHNVRNSKAFQMISSSSPPSSPDLNEEERNRVPNSKKKRGNPTAPTPAVNQPTTACGIAMVGSPGGGTGPTSALGHHSSNMLNKNIKLLDLFPAKGSHSRKMEAQKLGATARGHHLQEGRRRCDLQNYTRHSRANNDRSSAQQRRVQKVGGGGERK